MKSNKYIFIFGPPRSGTSWIAKMLSLNENINYVYEPDNEKNNFTAYYFKRHLTRFPFPETTAEQNKLYAIFKYAVAFKEKRNHFFNKLAGINKNKSEIQLQKYNRVKYNNSLWLNILFFFNSIISKRKDNRTILIKSVHSCLYIPEIVKEFKSKILIIFRHPYAVIASYNRLNMPDANRRLFTQKSLWNSYIKPYAQKFNTLNTDYELYGFQLGLFHHILKSYIDIYNYLYVKYEDFYPNPELKFKELYNYFALSWNKKIVTDISNTNKSGHGFSTNRNMKTQMDQWKNELTSDQIEQIKRGYNIFPNQIYEL